MILNQLAVGLWHIEQFLPDNQWQSVQENILSIEDSAYKNRHEPMRIRLEIQNPSNVFYRSLVDISINTVKTVADTVLISNLRNPPGLFLWRDFAGFRSDWHPDDFTHCPTAQVYIDGDEVNGTSFRVNNEEITIPFKPNTGYLMDNRYQLIHGMLTPVQNKVRQSIYLIY